MKQRFVLNTLVVLLIGLCLVDGNAMAQTEYLNGGTKALQFQIQNDFLLRSFDGTTISLKKQKSSDRAYRLGLTIDASITDDNQSSTNAGGTSTNDQDANSQNVAILLQKVFYTHPTNRTYAYFGVGPTGSVARSKSSGTATNTSGAVVKTSSLGRTWAAGLTGSFGVEWFAYRSISFLAEYNTSAVISWLKQRSETSPTGGPVSIQETKRTTYHLSDDGVRFGLAVYF